jgi:hypothetical protein
MPKHQAPRGWAKASCQPARAGHRAAADGTRKGGWRGERAGDRHSSAAETSKVNAARASGAMPRLC